MNKKFTIIIIILLALIIFVLGIYLFLVLNKKTIEQSTVETPEQSLVPSGDFKPFNTNFRPPLSENGGGGRPNLPPREGNKKLERPVGKDVVKTDAGEKYDIDISGIVGFLNNNATFKKVLKGYQSVNLIITTSAENINLLVTLNSDGSVKEITDGSNVEAAFTLTAPLNEIQNVITNYSSLDVWDILNLLKKLTITPESAKTEILGKILSK